MLEECTLPGIINSLLETDLYKLSMGQAIFHQFNKIRTKWAFKCRNKGVVFTPAMIREIQNQVGWYCGRRFNEVELAWLKENIPWLSEDYISYLRRWYPRLEQIEIKEVPLSQNPCGMEITAEGEWSDTSMYEIPILAIVNEVYFAFAYDRGQLEQEFKARTTKKLNDLWDNKYRLGVYSEFGLRRRLSRATQKWLVKTLATYGFGASECVGTSNVYLAMLNNIKPMGTMAHEWIQVIGQALHEHNPSYSNRYMMKYWVREYQTKNGIALTDTITTDCFLQDFNETYATLFSGVRHDSGDPIAWGEKMLAHYRKLGIDPETKTLLFSDSLDFERATKIYDHFHHQTNVAFGIGTYLSNDAGVEPLNIVMKVVEANGCPVAKLSDVDGKNMCMDKDYINYLKRTIAWRLEHEA